MKITTPPHSKIVENQANPQKERDSNLELFRIIVMMLIVMHHYVVNSSIFPEIKINPFTPNSAFMTAFGLWGKCGINCFVIITCWFMCKSRITLKKFLKLLLEVMFYKLIFSAIFLVSGYETLSKDSIRTLLPIDGVDRNFVSCFILFYLFIPFLNTLIQNLTKREHGLLALLTLGIYTLIGSSMIVQVNFNYITWFIVLYIAISYIRFYGLPINISHKLWGWLTIAGGILSIASIFVITKADEFFNQTFPTWYFVSDSNKILPFATALCSFMWFKDLKIKNSKMINTIAASTFGVLLIHGHSESMRVWLWEETLKNVQYFYGNHYAIHALLSCLGVFVICIAIDRLRIFLLERPLFNWIERKWGEKITK